MQTTQLQFIDTHCHLYSDSFDEDRADVIQRAIEAGISGIMLPNIDMQSIDGMHQLVNNYPGLCFPMMGLHPCSVQPGYGEVLEAMYVLLNTGHYYGIGETGVDLYWDVTYKDLQVEAFEIQIGWAKEKQLPIIIHSRESLDLNIGIIEKHHSGNLTGIFHCFNGTIEQAMRIAELGFKIGIGGVATFKNGGLNNVLPYIPDTLMVLETDAPYLAPVPHRGKRNEPAYTRLVAERVAAILDKPLGEVAEVTNRNAAEVFGKKI